MDWTGQTVAGRYVIEQKLDAGGMGTVYIARDTGVRGRQVVVKVPHPKLLTPEFRRRFEIEIDQLVALEHPHVVHVYGAGTHGDVPYLAVQYLAGGDLNARIRKGTLPPGEVTPWLRSIAGALDHAHRNGCIHRDVKPGNIIFDAEGHAYLSDFGIATVVSSAESSGEGLTQAGTFLGSIPYLPPEAMAREFAPPYDQYSLALVVYHALSGKMAFEGETTRAILEAKVSGRAVSLDLRVAGLPPGVVAAVMRAIEVDPRNRFESCTAFADAFEAGLLGASERVLSQPAELRPAPMAAAVSARDAKGPTTGPIAADAGLLGAVRDNLQLVGLGAFALLLAGLLVWLVVAAPEGEAPETALDPSLPVAAPVPVAAQDPGPAPDPRDEPSVASTESVAPVPSETEPAEGGQGAEPEVAPVPIEPRAFFARRDATLFDADRVDATVLGLVAAGEQVRGVPNGTGWVRVEGREAGEGFVRLAALGDAPVAPAAAPERRVVLVPAGAGSPEFRIDTREVPVRAYRACVAARGCSAAGAGRGCRSAEADGESRANCITAAQASEFCAWAGKRLASEEEWLRGAAVPEAGGFAGGIAEWTASVEGGEAVVRESPDSRFTAPPTAAFPDVGFRCATG